MEKSYVDLSAKLKPSAKVRVGAQDSNKLASPAIVAPSTMQLSCGNCGHLDHRIVGKVMISGGNERLVIEALYCCSCKYRTDIEAGIVPGAITKAGRG